MLVFVVLHYITTDDTKKCVASLQEHAPNSPIIIVDNGSPNNSGAQLKKLYAKNKNITVLLNEANLGFAAGNNIGFKYAKEHYNPDYIVLCNSDTKIVSNDFAQQIENKYKETGFAVLGPREQLPDGQYYPPLMQLPTIPETKTLIKKFRFRTKCPYTSAFFAKIRSLPGRFLKRPQNSFDPNEEYRNVVLHGAFLIFSKKYIDKFDGLDERTFLYGEEQLLAIRLEKNHMLSLYSPTITILHNHHSSTKAATENSRQRIQKRAEYELESEKIILEELIKLQKAHHG